MKTLRLSKSPLNKKPRQGNRQGKPSWLTERITAIPEGHCATYPLAEVNYDSYRTRASELNKQAGYLRYSISRSLPLGLLIIECRARPTE